MEQPVGFDDQPAAEVLLGSLLTGIDQVIHGKLFRISSDELVTFGQQVETLARKVFAAQVRIADEIDGQGLALQRGYSSTPAMLREVLRISPADATTRVKAAKATLPQDLPSGGEAPPVRPLLGAAINAGAVGAEHVRTTLATFRHLPKGLSEQVVAEAEELLVGHAGQVGPAEYDRIARHLELVLNPDGILDEKDCQARAEFSIGSRNPGTGLTPISGKLDDQSVQQLRQAIEALSKATPSADGVVDSRPAANRRAMGLAMLASWFLRSGDGPATGGEVPRVVITIDWELMQRQLGAAATTDSGLPMSAGQVRRMLCDAEVMPAVLGTDSQVLDLGRTVRLFPPSVRRAIALRDKGCAFPGCDRPPSWCEAHHVDWWERDLGSTSYHTGCLLCQFHHTLIHQGDWTVTMEEGRPTFWPPPWIDPQRNPRRNNLHHLDRLRG